MKNVFLTANTDLLRMLWLEFNGFVACNNKKKSETELTASVLGKKDQTHTQKVKKNAFFKIGNTRCNFSRNVPFVKLRITKTNNDRNTRTYFPAG